MRVRLVAMRVALPELLLANAQTRTMVSSLFFPIGQICSDEISTLERRPSTTTMPDSVTW